MRALVSLSLCASLSAAVVACGSGHASSAVAPGSDAASPTQVDARASQGDDGPAPQDASAAGDGPSTNDATVDAGSALDATVVGTVSFLGDWDKDPAKGVWKDIQVVTATKLQNDPSTPTWHGKGAARVEVDPGDDPLNLGENTERAEVLQMQDDAGKAIPENDSSATQYFAFSYLFPSNWSGTELSGDSNSWSIVFQLHGPDSLGASPAFSLSAAEHTDAGPEIYSVGTNVGSIASGCCGPSYSLSGGGAIRLGKWTDFVMMMTFASTPTGHITVWRRDQGQTAFAQVLDVPNVATLQYQSGQAVGDHYWKQGLYRGGVNRTDVLWIGPTVRATTFQAAEMAAFGTANGL
jgi:Polysaccharide lyase